MTASDIFENNISENLLRILLQDHSTHQNIFWATSDYEPLGKGYEFHSPIELALITGVNGNVIMPRVLKEKSLQKKRVKNKAEIFTPAWICNAQNNTVDEAWLGRPNVFNEELYTNNVHDWMPTSGKIVFPEDKTWMDYVLSNRLEITCGEAPYLISRYDTTTGDAIPIVKRIGLLDRKLRVVGENTDTVEEWWNCARQACQSIYGYEWQGDSLLLARESFLFSFIDYFRQKFNSEPSASMCEEIAEIISWNIWQMDGLKMVVPESCTSQKETDLFGNVKESPCPGCKNSKPNRKHTGIYCYIMNWKANEKVRFIDLFGKKD